MHKKCLGNLFLYFLCFTMSGCGNDEVVYALPETTVPIKCHVHTGRGIVSTRSLIETDDQLESVSLALDESISVWGDFVYNGKTYSEFVGTELKFISDEEGGIWDYRDYDRYWVQDALYNFLACYPTKALENQVMTVNANSLSVSYNTQSLQEDLLVAYKQIDAKEWNLSEPVPLQMEHALAAVKFKVKSEDGRAMTLKSLSLSGLYTAGDFNYQGKDKPVLSDWANHSGNTASYDWTGTLAFGGTAADVKGYTGASPLTQYAEDGFILVIPQQNCTPALDIVTTDKVYDRAVLGKVDFEPGKQYVYTITVTPADALEVTLRIKPWNELNSSYDITF